MRASTIEPNLESTGFRSYSFFLRTRMSSREGHRIEIETGLLLKNLLLYDVEIYFL